ncbi:hypothetical protein EMIHUDRAFT_249537 [Emiliania huxleyi CCMP1516]|nr:hypothetical protein EMIHUDRAFT_249537 [Emiliania huxleyi CCMP1516]EOD07414.1 hypothetical protein EMIHUDRAFT_249537 [Emiliania huxleyi CCMP1516]|eukprot:XP_005759843.1 hypothetical protein EMIHUDRAFT_249537 [Emiliania huxleyi CCMP1516]
MGSTCSTCLPEDECEKRKPSFYDVVRLISSIPDSPASFNLSELGSVSGQNSPTGRGSLVSALGWSNRPRTTDAPLLVGKGSHSLGPLLVQRQKTLPMNPSKGHSEAERYCGDAAERGVMRANSLPRSRRSSGSWASFDAVPEKAAPNVVSI